MKDLAPKLPPKPKVEDESSDSDDFEPTPRLEESKGVSDSSLFLSGEVVTIEDTYKELEDKFKPPV